MHVNVPLEDDENKWQCIRVLLGSLRDGAKESMAMVEGYRESTGSWQKRLINLKQCSLIIDPKLTIRDGPPRFWIALREIFPDARKQRWWVHKAINLLDKTPKTVHPRAKRGLHQIWMAKT